MTADVHLVKRLTPKPRKKAASLLAATDGISTVGLFQLIGFASGLVASRPRYPAVVPLDLAKHRAEVAELIRLVELVADDALPVLLSEAKAMATEHPRRENATAAVLKLTPK